MEPKAYSASPVGTTFLVAAGSRSTGSVVFDPTLPIRDVEADINGIALGVGTTFGLFGKLTLVSAVLPYAWGPWDVDAYLGVWLFTSNGDFYPGRLTRAQGSGRGSPGPRQLHVQAAAVAGGGQHLVLGRQCSGGRWRASRRREQLTAGDTLSLPAGRQQSFKISYSSGVAVRTGTDFRTLAVGWQWLWFRP
jgi:hypothetical protein